MKKFLKSFRNYSLMLGLSFVLFSCGRTQTFVMPQEVPTSGVPPASGVLPASSETPASSEAPASSETPITSLIVNTDFSLWDCSCGGVLQQANIKLDILNGVPPFNINGQKPVYERQVIFPASPGASFPLSITSFDNFIYQANIDVPLGGSCKPPENSCGGSNNNGKSCHEEPQVTCKQVPVTTKVCTDWAGNSGNCKKWEDKVTYEKVCTTTEKMVCN